MSVLKQLQHLNKKKIKQQQNKNVFKLFSGYDYETETGGDYKLTGFINHRFETGMCCYLFCLFIILFYFIL